MKLDTIILILLLEYFIETKLVVGDSGSIYQFMVMAESWYEAVSTCTNINGTFVPDLGSEEIVAKLLDEMEENEMVWLNGKEIMVKYEVSGKTSKRCQYVETSFRAKTSRLEHYLCSRGDLSSSLLRGRFSWTEVHESCLGMRGDLFNISSPPQVRSAMPYLSLDKIYWINKYAGNVLPDMNLDTNLVSELCIGIIKESDTAFTYRTADCGKKFKYFCDRSTNNSQLYAPTIKRRAQKMAGYDTTPIVTPQPTPDDTKTHEKAETPQSNVWLIAGPAAGCVVLLGIGAVFAVVMIKKRKRRKKYRKRRIRYISERRKMRDGTSFDRSEAIELVQRDGPYGTPSPNKHSVILVDGMEKGGRYVHLRGDGESPAAKRHDESRKGQCDVKSHNIDQPGYFFMDIKPKSSTVSEPDANESQMFYTKFDPDLKKLEDQMKNRHTSSVPVKLESDLTKLSKSPKLPLKPLAKKNKKRGEEPNTPGLYEQPMSSVVPPKLPVKKFRGPVYLNKARLNIARQENDQATNLPEQHGNNDTQENELYAHKHLGDYDLDERETDPIPEKACMKSNISSFQTAAPILDELGVYESYDSDQTNACSHGDDLTTAHDPSKTLETNAAVTSLQNLNDLDQYENFNRTAEVRTLDDLDQYENYKSPTMNKKQMQCEPMHLNDLKDYENCPVRVNNT